MDTLVSIGVLTAWSYSVVLMTLTLTGVRHGQMTYFAEATALLAVISLGHWLEARATAKAGSAVRTLLEMQPDTAERIDDDEQITEVAIEAIFKGDRLLVRPGARVAVDGTIIEGISELDESVVTGETDSGREKVVASRSPQAASTRPADSWSRQRLMEPARPWLESRIW